MQLEKIDIFTKDRYELVDITGKIKEIIKQSKIQNGLAIIFVPHSTAGIILTENEEGLKKDWLKFLEKIVSNFDFNHNKIDDNADSHILSGIIGQEKILLIENGSLVQGTWQQIFLAEFDGPRTRTIIVKIILC
jgi:secondary thiamine-phosphate synthase enzyme